MMFLCKNEQKHFLFDDTKVQKKTVKELYEYNLKELEKIMDSEHKKMNPKAIEPINFLTKISGHESSGDMTYYGVFNFSNEDLMYWKDWYTKNKDSLNYIYSSKDTLDY